MPRFLTRYLLLHDGPRSSACTHFSEVLDSTDNTHRVLGTPSLTCSLHLFFDISQQVSSHELKTHKYLTTKLKAFEEVPVEKTNESIRTNSSNYWKMTASVFKYNPSHKVLLPVTLEENLYTENVDATLLKDQLL